MGELHFVSFADSRLKGPFRRIRRQAERMGVFGDRIHVWTEKDLSPAFRTRFAEHLVPGSRGYGYWCWKPQVILQMFDLMQEGDVLFYVDAGCHLNARGRKRLLEYAELAREWGIVSFQARSMIDSEKNNPVHHFLLEAHWSKGDLLDYFHVRDRKDVLRTGQIAGTTFFVQKDTRTQDLFRRFLAVFEEHFQLADDTPSESPNLPGFVENRHDQSIFGILLKLDGYPTLSCGEYCPIRDYAPEVLRGDSAWGPATWRDLRDYPIWAKHDKGGFRSYIPGWAKNLIRKVMG